MARDPARIPIILDQVREAWETMPDLRLGQLLINAARPKGQTEFDLYYVEDDVLLDVLQDWVETSKNWSAR